MTKYSFARVLIGAVALTGCLSTPTPEPTYEVVHRRVLSNCTTRSCHGAVGRKGDLVLTFEEGYAQLVGVPAANDTARSNGKVRVIPGDAEASFLLQKLTSPAPNEGERMPYGGPPLPQEDIELVRRWIANGAKRASGGGGVPTAP